MKFTAVHFLLLAMLAGWCAAPVSSRAQQIGDPADAVRAGLGAPSMTRDAGAQQIWVYPNGLKVTIENDVVTEVRGPAVNLSAQTGERAWAAASSVQQVADDDSSASTVAGKKPAGKKAGKPNAAPRAKTPAPAPAKNATAAADDDGKKGARGIGGWVIIGVLAVVALWMRHASRRSSSSPASSAAASAGETNSGDTSYRLPLGGVIAWAFYGAFFVVVPAVMSGKAATPHGLGFICGTMTGR